MVEELAPGDEERSADLEPDGDAREIHLAGRQQVSWDPKGRKFLKKTPANTRPLSPISAYPTAPIASPSSTSVCGATIRIRT